MLIDGVNLSGCDDVAEVNIIIQNMKTALSNTYAALPLTHKELLILKSIRNRENMGETITSAEISDMFSISKAAVSQFVSSLEKRGFLTRRHSYDDRRRVYFETTEIGKSMVDKSNAYLDENFNIVKERLGLENFETLLRLVREATEILAEISKERVENQ